MCDANMILNLIGVHSWSGHSGLIPIVSNLALSPYVGYVAYYAT